MYKLSLNGGMTCPNRDGTLGSRGCIFCSAGGSGEFAASRELSITAQIEEAKKRVEKKNPSGKYIAYFQAYTNTYAPVECLRGIFTEAIRHPDITALSIATRPDCLPPEVIVLLKELNREKPVWVELGLQTVHERTAAYIRRGYALSCFHEAADRLRAAGILVIVHVILGLPGESKADMLQTVNYIGHAGVQGIKLQLLHVLKGTDLAKDYEAGLFRTMELEEYLQLLCDCIEILPKDMVIHRLTGDGPKSLLLAPSWSGNKRMVLNALKQRLKEQKVRQGSRFI